MPKILPPLGLTLTYLRKAIGWSEGELAEALGVSASLISDYERGKKSLTRERLETIVAVMGFQRTAIDDALAFIDRVRAKAASPVYPTAETREAGAELQTIDRLGQSIADATSQVGRLLATHLSWEVRALADRQVAQGSLARLLRRTPSERRTLIRKTQEYRSWAVSELACAESLKAAPDNADRALEFAELAVEIAQQMTGEPLMRKRVEGYAGVHLGNARRVHGKLRDADEAFARALPLWKAGAPADPGLLNEARVLGLEASLRIGQRRPAEALALLDEALAVDRQGERKYLLVNRARALEQLGDYNGATAALRQAEPLVDGRQEPRLLFSLRFNLLGATCYLGLYAEAEEGLRKLRPLAERLGQALDLVRTRWLEGWVASGLGRREEAVAALEQVSRDFSTRQIPFDAAMATLQLTTIYLQEGRITAVRRLALGLAWIFKTEAVPPAALAALRLYYDAAEQEALTLDLAQRIGSYLYRAQGNPDLRFEAIA
ncbi:MAG TPA: helix-turn-helix domain-containing protein [Thermoanaerobaculia bacterium]|nr:helix-turn-helix domain-containing protein [Thermoanaerobaculia bacterium]